MTREEAIKTWLPIIVDGVKTMPELEEALEMAIKALEKEPCEDAISRQAVIDSIRNYFHDEYYQRTSIQDCRDCLIEDVIKPLPPVMPQPKTGHWIDTGSGQECSECGEIQHGYDNFRFYCPSCGCRMSEGSE